MTQAARRASSAAKSALHQIYLLTGDENASIRIRAIPSDRRNGKPCEFEGSLAAMHERAHKLNLDG